MSQEVAIDARIEECIEALIALDRCEELVGRLRSEDDQAIFRLHYYDCKTIVEIANELGKTVDATKTSLWRSRRALKNHVSDYDVLTE